MKRSELLAMQLEKGYIEAVISVPYMETADIGRLNDTASEEITGNDCGLEDISYELTGCNVNNQEVLIKVRGQLSSFFIED